jgi:hypothetical protein
LETFRQMEDIEIWKDVLGFEKRYMVSSFGNLYSKLRKRELKPTLDKDGYRSITLYNKGFHKSFRMSRMVAINFIPNPKNLPQVNHKDHIRNNDNVLNLEWCEDYENQRKRSEHKGGKTSKYVGVRYHSEPNNWQSRISIKRKTYTLGLFKTEIEASEAYQKAYNNYYKFNILPQ